MLRVLHTPSKCPLQWFYTSILHVNSYFLLKDTYVKVINVFANDFMLNLQSYELNKKFSVLSHYCVVEMSWLTKMKITMVLNFFLWIMKIKLVFLPFHTI